MMREVELYDEQCAEFAKFLKPKCVSLGYCPEHASCGREPKKHLVFNEYNKMKDVRQIMEDVRLGIYEDPECIIDELYDLCFPAEKD
jgi:hypothetical protein